ncbi:MAG TPA: DUF4129 domain-containing protein [Anaerolineae bacterium]|nr:DUF4129 domain-containing protein [Anaerolineae bacterium]
MDIEVPPGRYYWRGAVYARYDGGQWASEERERVVIEPDLQPPAGLERPALRRAVAQIVTNYVPGRSLLVGAADPVAFGRAAEGHARWGTDAPLELLRIVSTAPLKAGETYAVTSWVSEADVASLRAAGTDYPAWVRERYLQLPDGLPARVSALAETVTAGADNPYDRAVALEVYLRHHISYTLSPPPTPPGRDYVDYLLFESRRGYCDGYASAMVILARCVGLPARLAVGYSQGEYDGQRGVFRVRELDAHSWPEIYFPGYGWVQFEPTVTEEEIVRPERPPGPEPTMEPNPRPERVATPEGEPRERPIPEEDERGAGGGGLLGGLLGRLWRGLAAVLGGGLLLWGAWWGGENWGLRRLPPPERAYGRLLRFGRYLGRPLRTAETPSEWAQAFVERAPEARGAVERIVSLYLRHRFGRGEPPAPDAEAAWREARPFLWKRLLRRLSVLVSPPRLRRR